VVAHFRERSGPERIVSNYALEIREEESMSDRIVVLRSNDPLAFVADACAAVADLVNEAHVWRTSDPITLDTYSELLIALASLVRPTLDPDGPAKTHLAIIDHLVERLHQARAGDIAMPVVDIADRLHAELVSDLAYA
jgi:hypothetical protein